VDKKAIATLVTSKRIRGRLTTEHAASSYGQPVFVGDDNHAYNWVNIIDINTTEAQSKGGSRSTPAKRKAARESGKKGGRPRKKRDNDTSR